MINNRKYKIVYCTPALYSAGGVERVVSVKASYFADVDYFCERSWGMSHDYMIAVEEGSTMVRIGTTIFGPRVY